MNNFPTIVTSIYNIRKMEGSKPGNKIQLSK